ncbi:MAG: CoB--CoM heterodisulfide reductase iron-sulfur subunit A family protein [Candidatus Sumerlaeota bacterium]|nr:CoB--CoM heterodisulfide reductase iron-sulfur subunit A family protein [Candidatus Sumerlaeota bacterium]
MGLAKGSPRTGFYICHCGTNIADTVDVDAVRRHAEELPGVVVSCDYKYMCSDPGQELIIQDIKEHRLERVVVAACSPLLHEATFRGAVERGGLNPFLFHMVNIREQDAWVHEDRAQATRKARDLIRAAIRRVAYHRPLERMRVGVNPNTLIIGGGIAGINAALNLSMAGKRVYLVEREPTIGGHMAKYDKTFPTLDCAACILTPKMSAVRDSRNIVLWTYSEVEKIDGYIGNFRVQVRRKPRYVDEETCVGCMQCVDACIYKDARFPSEFELGLKKRKPVYMPFPQAVPPVVAIDPKTCLHFKTGKCKEPCKEACARDSIRFDQREVVEEIEVGQIIVATGFQTFDPARLPQYGYGEFPNVYTSLEIERLVNASGPTGGQVLLRNGQVPQSVGILHCVGSRDENTNRWCSTVCCMTALKLAHLVKEHTGATVYSFYIDMRCTGKGYEEFYDRMMREGVQFVRGRVGEVRDWEMAPEEEGKLVLRVEDTLAGFVRRIPVDLVILAVGMEPRADAEAVQRMLHISRSNDGFFLERHPKLAPVETTTDGVYLAGCCQGPKDIPSAVAQGSAAAAHVLAMISKGHIELEPNTVAVLDDCSGCKTCIPLCPYHALTLNEESKKAQVNLALCKGCGTCAAACPSGSITQNLFEDEQIDAEIEETLAHV